VGDATNINSKSERPTLTEVGTQALTSKLLSSSNNLALAEERARLVNDCARYVDHGFLPGNFVVAETHHTGPPRLTYQLYEQPASQAIERPPPLCETLKSDPYNSFIKLNVQITNVPEVSANVTGQELLNYFEKVSQAGVAGARSLEAHLAQPWAINNDLMNFGKALYRFSHYAIENPCQLLLDAGSAIQQTKEHAADAIDKLDKPMTPEQRAGVVGAMLPLFFLEGKLIDPQKAEDMGFRNMTAEELERFGVKRLEMPQLTLRRDEFSIQATVPGDDKTWVRAIVKTEGVIDVTSIERGSLPKGVGGEFLADTLREHAAISKKQLIFSSIKNGPTIASFETGDNPATSVLGITGTRALESLGLKPKCYRFEIVRDKLSLVIDVE
jgi:hypothetical protein